MGHKVLTLKKPVTIAGTIITELKFREEVVAGDMRGIKLVTLQEAPVDDLLKIAGRLCAQPDAVMNALSFADTMEIVGVVGGFLGDGAPTGTTGLPSLQ